MESELVTCLLEIPVTQWCAAKKSDSGTSPTTATLWTTDLRRHLHGHADDAGRASVHEHAL